MKIPVIRGHIGDWRYYTGVMKFSDIATIVTASVDEFCHPSCLSELLQRNLTENYKSITEYILKDEQRFFNAIVLAIYDGDPKWLEIEFGDEYEEYNNVGFLSLDDEIKIFPVDGQHRVKGIIEAIKEDSSRESETVPIIIIGHKDDNEGKRRTRKLFSTLNRRARPVGNNYEIALDEDDMAAIVTRELIEDLKLFQGKRLCNNNGKQIPTSDSFAFTSLIALYQCNEFLIRNKLGLKEKEYKNYKLYRPSEEVISATQQFINDYWIDFEKYISVITAYMSEDKEYASNYRNKNGGNILFRPIGLIEFVKATYYLSQKCNIDLSESIQRLSTVPMNIADNPWRGVIWDGKKIITRVSLKLLGYLLLFLENPDNLDEEDKEKMVDLYITAINYEGDRDKVIDEIIGG